MPARKWSDADLAEMRRLRLCMFTNAEIAGRFGVSYNVVTNLMRIYKIISPEEATDLRSRRMTGSKMPAKTRKRVSEVRKRQFREDPRFIAIRTRQSEAFKAGRAGGARQAQSPGGAGLRYPG